VCVQVTFDERCTSFAFYFISLWLRASVHAYFGLCFTPFQFVLSYSALLSLNIYEMNA
jgi:hypothetical protein